MAPMAEGSPTLAEPKVGQQQTVNVETVRATPPYLHVA